MRRLVALAAAMVLVGLAVLAQSPAPIVMQAAPDVTPAATSPPQNEADDADLIAEIELLQDLKAKNAETLKKQQAVLESLDQVQKDADQIRIFAKRG
jgi:hypothetical protein